MYESLIAALAAKKAATRPTAQTVSGKLTAAEMLNMATRTVSHVYLTEAVAIAKHIATHCYK